MTTKVSLDLPPTKGFVWVRKTTRKRTEQGALDFAADIRAADWCDILGEDPDRMVEKFDTWIRLCTDRHFPLHTVRRRSNEDPWITNGIRKRARHKRRLYREQGRSRTWKKADRDLEEEVAMRKQEFVDSLLEAPEKNYYAAVKKLAGPTCKKAWTVIDFYPGTEPKKPVEQVLKYFSTVGGEDERQEMPELAGPPVLEALRLAG